MTAALALLLVSPAAAFAAPGVTTGGASKVTQTTAVMHGTADPNGQPTTFYFEYGPTRMFGSRTGAVDAGAGNASLKVAIDVTGLAPATTYFYRIVAVNNSGTRSGGDRSFKTKYWPLGASLTATPNPVLFGKPTILGGSLSGVDNANRGVVLQSRPFPYTEEFGTVTNGQITSGTGTFAFRLQSVPVNTQYRVVTLTQPVISSPYLSVGVAPKIQTSVSDVRVHRGQRVRVSGTVRPALGGERVAIQKLKATRWITVAGTVTRRVSSASARYSKRIRVNSAGRYRVFVAIADGRYVAHSGRTVPIRLGGQL